MSPESASGNANASKDTRLELIPVGGGPVQSGAKIALRTIYNGYLSVWKDAPGDLTAIGTTVGRQEEFVIERLDAKGAVVGGDVVHGDRVVLTAANGMQLSAAGGGGGLIHANSTNRGAWETFTIVRAAGAGILRDGDEFGLSGGTHFISAGDGGGRDINMLPTSRSAWETLVPIVCEPSASFAQGTRVALRQVDTGLWLSAIDGGGKGIVMTDHVSAWEIFTIESAEVGRALGDGDALSVRTMNGHYLSLDAEGKPIATQKKAVPLALEVLAGKAEPTLTESNINDMVRIYQDAVDEVRRYVPMMVTSLVHARLRTVLVARSTEWVPEPSFMDPNVTIPVKKYLTRLVDTRGVETVMMEDRSEKAYDDSTTFYKEKDHYEAHLEWDYRSATYPSVEVLETIGKLPPAIRSTITRLNTDPVACSQYRYAAVRARVV
jgi:hypothetical protein